MNNYLHKFLFVIDYLGTGGAQRQMVNLALGLKKRGHEISFFCYAPGDLLAKPLYDSGIPVYFQIKKSRFSADVLLGLRRHIQKGEYDLALAFLSTPSFYALMTGQLLGAPRIPVVVSERSCDPPEGLPFSESFVRYLYRAAAYVIANSHHQRETLVRKYSFLRSRVSTIYNGYDLDLFTPAACEPDNHPIRIATIASVSYIKNGLCLIEALKILAEKYRLHPQVDWIGQQVMFGDRLECLKEMDAKIQAYGLQQQWQWLGQRTDIIPQLHQHDLLVHPSYLEGLPNVVCEALCCARPVIVSNTLDHGRLVQHGQSGFLFDWHDPADLAEKIRQFIEMPVQERRKMGLCGRSFAEENLTQERLVDEYERIFINILDGGKP